MIQKISIGLLFSFLAVGSALLFAEDVPGSPRGPVDPNDHFCSYSVQAGIDGEIYPVFANYASLQRQKERSFATVAVTIKNPTVTPVRQQVSVQVPGWSDREVQSVDVEPGKTRTFLFAPSFLPRLYQNHEIVAATAQISATDIQGRSLYESSIPVRLRAAEDMYWGSDFKYASFIASWVTPHDSQVEATLARAKQYISDHRLPGYEEWKNTAGQEAETWREAQAIFTALQRSGFSYVKSSSTLGAHQDFSERVRMPRASMEHSSANCIDAAVAYASLFENLGMDAEVILVPGHAYVGVRVARKSPKFLVIDAALTGRATFATAVAAAQKGLTRQHGDSIRQIVISEARSTGIYPMPL